MRKYLVRFAAEEAGAVTVDWVVLTAGVVAFGVRQRRPEMSVRMALGASRRRLLTLVVGESLKLTLTGALLGIVLSLALTRSMSSLLFGVTPTDPVTLAGAAVLLLGAGVLAAWGPARRATHVDPVMALKEP